MLLMKLLSGFSNSGGVGCKFEQSSKTIYPLKEDGIFAPKTEATLLEQ